MAAGRRDLLEEPQAVVRVGVRDEPLRPVGDRLRADADVPDVLQVRRQQRLDVAAQHARAHDHRIAAGEEHVGHITTGAQVGDEIVRLLRLELQILHAHELRPPEAVRAVGVAGLARSGKEQDRLAVLVLQPGQRPPVELRDVVRELPRRVGVQAAADPLHLGGERLGVAAGQHAFDRFEIAAGEHLPLREHELEQRIVRHPGPVDQLVHHVPVRAKRQHLADHTDRGPQVRVDPLPVRHLRDVAQVDRAIPGVVGRRTHGVEGLLSNPDQSARPPNRPRAASASRSPRTAP